MEYDLPVAQMARGDDIEGFYVLKSAFSKVANNGKPFLNLTLSDRTGAVDAKVWDYPGPIGAADEGKVVKIRGSVSEFRGALQVTVERIRLAGEDDRYDVTALVPTAPIDGEAMYASVEALLDSITDADYKAVCRELLRRHSESFRTIPAAKSVHHGFLHGLLMHTGNMMQLAGFLAGMYADTVDRSLLLAGTFAHDLQKEREFRFSALGLVTDYSVPGQLLGHLVMGAQEIAEIAKELDVPEPRSLPPRRAGVRRGGASGLRRERAFELHRHDRQPHGDLPRGARRHAARRLQRSRVRARRQEALSPRMRRKEGCIHTFRSWTSAGSTAPSSTPAR